jgi:hypothetical protein
MRQPQNHTSETTQNQNINDIIMSLMGVDRLAYIRSEDELSHTVFAADGTALADFDSQEEALEAIAYYKLTPVRLH